MGENPSEDLLSMPYIMALEKSLWLLHIRDHKNEIKSESFFIILEI